MDILYIIIVVIGFISVCFLSFVFGFEVYEDCIEEHTSKYRKENELTLRKFIKNSNFNLDEELEFTIYAFNDGKILSVGNQSDIPSRLLDAKIRYITVSCRCNTEKCLVIGVE